MRRRLNGGLSFSTTAVLMDHHKRNDHTANARAVMAIILVVACIPSDGCGKENGEVPAYGNNRCQEVMIL